MMGITDCSAINAGERTETGIVVIGRNEGRMLERALGSAQAAGRAVLYVDSGSTDNSLQIAQSLNIPFHSLDPGTPFSPARARSEGIDVLTRKWPDIQFVQFLDGDCILESDWNETAVAYLRQHPRVGIVSGRLTERHAQESIYNRLASMKWQEPAGEVKDCGGIFMIRRSVYEAVGGFNGALLTGEEAELCSRVQSSGSLIIRLEQGMASHDSDQHRFMDWWRRVVWGGYGIAVAYDALQRRLTPKQRRDTCSSFFWALGLPTVILLGVMGTLLFPKLFALPILCVFLYIVLFFKIFYGQIRKKGKASDAALYALFCILAKFAFVSGYFRYWIVPVAKTARPDPHAQ